MQTNRQRIIEQWHEIERIVKDTVEPRILRALTPKNIEDLALKLGPKFAKSEKRLGEVKAVSMTRDTLIRCKEEAQQNAEYKRQRIYRHNMLELICNVIEDGKVIARAGDKHDIKGFSDDGETCYFYVLDNDAVDDPFAVASTNIDNVMHII